MSYARTMAAELRKELFTIEESIPVWEAGKIHICAAGVDVTQRHIEHLHWVAKNLRTGIQSFEEAIGAEEHGLQAKLATRRRLYAVSTPAA
jgi:hypothetical protein